ncbi:MAG TPA: hypothetical protein VIS06_19070 [Mycobacteriales bacterium]
MTGDDTYGAGGEGSIQGTNVASGNAHVDTQAGYIVNYTIVHADYQNTYLNQDNSPKETLRVALNRLDGGSPQHAEELFESALAREPSLFCPDVAYHQVLAMLSGRSLQDLEDERFEALLSCFDRAREQVRDQWRDALDVVEEFLACRVAQEEHDGRQIDTVRLDRASACLARLPGARQEEISRHLRTLLAGAREDRTDAILRAQVIEHRMGRDRKHRVRKFFEPVPAAPRMRVITRPPCDREVVLSIVGAALGVFGTALALVTMGRESLPWTAAVVVLCGGGGAVLVRYGREHLYLSRRRAARLRAISEVDPARRSEVRIGSGSERFATRIDEFVRGWFVTHPPLKKESPRQFAVQTAGLRTALRDDLILLYDDPAAPRVEADQVLWLIQWHAERIARAWEDTSLYAFHDLRSLGGTVSRLVAALAALSAGCLLGVIVMGRADILTGLAATVLVGVGGRLAVTNGMTVYCAQRGYEDDTVENEELFREEKKGYERRRAELSDRPGDAQMARWLDWDKVHLRARAMQKYRLTNRDVLAHFVLVEGLPDVPRARMAHGLTRYLAYTTRVFLLTDHGVRELEVRLDFDSGAENDERRVTFPYGAISSARIGERTVHRRGRRQVAEPEGGGPNTGQPRPVLGQALTLTLVSGEEITIHANHDAHLATEHRQDADALEQLVEDTASVVDGIHLLESVAADGHRWIRRERNRRRSR